MHGGADRRPPDEVYDLGVRDMELVNKFDNGLAGVAGDGGTTGVVVNSGNKRRDGPLLADGPVRRTRTTTTRSSRPRRPAPDRDQLAGNV